MLEPKPILTNKLLFLNKYYFLEVFEDMPDTDEVYKNSTTFVYITLIAFLRWSVALGGFSTYAFLDYFIF